MRSVGGTLQSRVDEAREIGGRSCPRDIDPDIFDRTLVGDVCKRIWPDKTDVEIAIICHCDPRNARRYLSGELAMPSVLLSAINARLVIRPR